MRKNIGFIAFNLSKLTYYNCLTKESEKGALKTQNYSSEFKKIRATAFIRQITD